MSDRPLDSRRLVKNWSVVQVLLGGMLGMVVAMGIGRFVFTPILPLMQRDLGLSHSAAGWLAGLNYLGYLAGAVLCSVETRVLRCRWATGGALLLCLFTTLSMGMTISVFWWGGLRFAGGVASAVLFIVISAEVGEALIRLGAGRWFGVLFGGVGLGIALSGLMVPWLDKVGGWSGSWIGAGVVATVLAVAGITLGRKHELVRPVVIDPSAQRGDLRCVRLLALAYFFEGLGYIVTATFLVAIVAVTPGLERFAHYSWVAVGLAAIPSTLFWPYLAYRIGRKQALLAAYALQAAGILVSIQADSAAEVVFVAVSFGGTFLGIVAVTLAEGRQRMSGDGGRAAAYLTACFGVGQVLGPVIAGRLADSHQGFTLPLLIATVCVVLGGAFVAMDRRYQSL